ncbi:MAG: hypothetical protein LUH11_03625, partial [Candidatus Gastranaerophilales bacterium]|nr:hypothetical protein [Candidatus Gastranaerophilales bacterium]
MHIKNHYIRLLIKSFIIIVVLECLYLFTAPYILEKIAGNNFINKKIIENTNASITYSDIKIKTHIRPDIT